MQILTDVAGHQAVIKGKGNNFGLREESMS